MSEPEHRRIGPRPEAQKRPEGVLTSIIHRLEAATSRLEDIASSSFAADSSVASTGAPAAVAASAASTASTAAAPTAKVVESLPPSLAAFDELVNTELKTWLDLSSKLGPVIESQSKAVERAFAAQRIVACNRPVAEHADRCRCRL